MDMGFFFTGLFIAADQRINQDGQPDGWNVSFACGTDSYKFKVPDGIFAVAHDAGMTLGSVCSFRCKFSTFNGRTYYRADSPITILS